MNGLPVSGLERDEIVCNEMCYYMGLLMRRSYKSRWVGIIPPCWKSCSLLRSEIPTSILPSLLFGIIPALQCPMLPLPFLPRPSITQRELRRLSLYVSHCSSSPTTINIHISLQTGTRRLSVSVVMLVIIPSPSSLSTPSNMP